MKVKKPWKNRLTVKIPFINTMIVIVIMAIICFSMSTLTYNAISKMVKQEISYLADINADMAGSYLESMDIAASLLAEEVSRYQDLNETTAKGLLEDTLVSALDDEKLFATYFAFEPNKYFSNTSDGYSMYAYRDGNRIIMEILEDYDMYYAEDYYATSKEKLATHITEPYIYDLGDGNEVLLITVSVPIFSNSNEFIGVVNCDILANELAKLNYNNGGYESAYSYIVTQEGTYIAHTANPELAGTNMNGSTEVMESIRNAESFVLEGKETYTNGISAWISYRPIHLENLDAVWSSVFVSVKSEALEQVNFITFIVVLISLIGTAVLAFASFVALRKGLQPLGGVMEMADKMGQCDLKYRIPGDKSEDELGQLAAIFEQTTNTLDEYVEEVSQVLQKLANGDYDTTITKEYIGDFAKMKEALTLIVDSLNDTFGQIRMAADEVAIGSDQVSSSAVALSEGAMEQAAAVEQLSASISDIAYQVNENADNAKSANQLSNETGQKIMESNDQMQAMVVAMDQIKESSNEISKIIKTIDDIAFQTNILALNAAVEAARAGETGKGFAVVADEVRNLAQKSAEAAQNTTALIEGTIAAVENGTKIAHVTAESLNTVVEKASKITGQINEMADASAQQAVAIEQINQGIEQISSVVQTNSATSQESAAASEQLSAQARTLKELLSKFKLKG